MGWWTGARLYALLGRGLDGALGCVGTDIGRRDPDDCAHGARSDPTRASTGVPAPLCIFFDFFLFSSSFMVNSLQQFDKMLKSKVWPLFDEQNTRRSMGLHVHIRRWLEVICVCFQLRRRRDLRHRPQEGRRLHRY